MNTALVIDGSDEVRRITSLVLVDAGYSVETAKDALDGLDHARRLKPQLVLVDFALAEMRGLHLLSKIREVAPESHIGVMVANPGDPSVEKARNFGNTSLVVKGPGIISYFKTLQVCAQRPGKAAAEDAAAAERAKILIVDDEESIRTVLKRFLEKKGYDISTAKNGIEALKAIETDRPVLVLLDVKMPGMDGLQVLEKIKSIAPGIAVMMITGNTDEDIAKECMKRGAFDYISKPLNFDYLETSVMAKILISTS